jgi:SAM-dependent methyltransferase/uncharacterized protein YbaR (Trm112 family)
MIDMLRCPLCREALTLDGEPENASDAATVSDGQAVEILGGSLRCGNAHRFEIVDGVPRLLPHAATDDHDGAAESIQTTYDAMWARFQPGDTEWSIELEDRVADFLAEVRLTVDELAGRLVLDAGCGPGTLTRAINRYGCESVGLDVSESVAAAFERYATDASSRAHFVQGDLVNHPFRDDLFDVIYSGGVLHLNPDPAEAFHGLCRPLKPGGTMYIWVYGKTPGRYHAIRQSIRSFVSRMPQRVRYGFVLLWLPQAMLRQYVRSLLGKNEAGDRLKWRERFVHLLDHYTPQYRWELSQEEVQGWFDDAGFGGVEFSSDGLGFGVVGRMTLDKSPAS